MSGLLERAQRDGAAPLPGLRLCVCAGERCPDALAERIAATLGTDVMICLGATKLMHVVLATRSSRLAPGAVGFPVSGVTVTVRDEKGQLVPDGAQGRLHIAGENVALGYLCPEEDAAVFADGGANTNNIVVRTADDAVDYVCRADAMAGALDAAGGVVELWLPSERTQSSDIDADDAAAPDGARTVRLDCPGRCSGALGVLQCALAAAHFAAGGRGLALAAAHDPDALAAVALLLAAPDS